VQFPPALFGARLTVKGFVGARHLVGHGCEPTGAFLSGQCQFVENSLIEELAELHGGKKLTAYLPVPVFEGDEVGKINDIVLENPAEIGIAVRSEVDNGCGVGFWNDQLAICQHVVPQDGSGGRDVAEAEAHRAHHPALASQEDWRLIQHDPAGHIPQERGSRFVAVGSEIEMDIGAPHFTVIFPAFASCHEAVTEIDKAPEGHKREENGLFQADAMSPVRLLLEKAGLADVGAQPQIGPGKEDRPFAVSPFELNHGADLAVVDGDRTFGSNLRPLSNHGCLPVDATSRIDLDPVTGDMVEVNLIAKVKSQRVRDIDSLGH